MARKKPRVKITKVVPEEAKVVLEVYDAPPLPEELPQEVRSVPVEPEKAPGLFKWLKDLW